MQRAERDERQAERDELLAEWDELLAPHVLQARTSGTGSGEQ